MACYLAKIEDYQKIADFINQQSKTTLGRDCIEFSLKRVKEISITADTLKKMRDERQGYEMFVCEDNLGNIRYIHGRERRGKEFSEKEMAVGGDGVMAQIDREQKNNAFRIELWNWIVKYQYDTYGIKSGEYNVPQEELNFVKGFFGEDAIEAEVQITVPTEEYQGREYSRIIIDFEKYLKKIKYI